MCRVENAVKNIHTDVIFSQSRNEESMAFILNSIGPSVFSICPTIIVLRRRASMIENDNDPCPKGQSNPRMV